MAVRLLPRVARAHHARGNERNRPLRSSINEMQVVPNEKRRCGPYPVNRRSRPLYPIHCASFALKKFTISSENSFACVPSLPIVTPFLRNPPLMEY